MLLNWESGVLIVEGNVLVPCTLIVQGISCRRKAILSHYFKGGSRATKEMLIGNVVHELFQVCIITYMKEFAVTWIAILAFFLSSQMHSLDDKFFILQVQEATLEKLKELMKIVP